MVTAITVKEKIQGLIDKSNNTTGNSDTTLTDAVNALVEGYGAGGAAIIEPITITENGVYPVPKGGLEFGKEYTFKKDITVEDFEHYIENATQLDGPSDVDLFSITIIENENGMSGAMGTRVYYTQYPDRPPVYEIQVATNSTPQFSFRLNSINPEIPDGWCKVEISEEDGTESYTPIDTPPTITLLEDATMYADLATTAVFFDVETKALDGWGDITVNVTSSDKKVLQYGKFAKFKDNITDQMFEEYVAQATPVVNDPAWGDIYLLCLDESRCAWLISNNPDVGGWTIMDPAQVRMYMTG